MSTEPSARPFTESSERILAVLAGGTLVFIAGQLVIPPLLPTIVEDYSISLAQAGVGLTIMWVCAALSMYPGGRLSDQLTRPTVLVASTLLAATGLGAASVAPAFPVFVLALGIVGVGIGLWEPTSFATVSDLFVSARGRAYGVIAATYNIGSGVAAGLAAAALAIGYWQVAFLPVVASLLLLGLLFNHLRSGPYRIEPVSFAPVTALRRVLITQQLRLLLVLFALYMFLWQGSISFFPTLLRTDLGLSQLFATAVFASIFAIGLTMNPVAGALGDRLGHSRVGVFAPCLGAIELTILLLVPTIWGVVVGTVMFAVGLVTFWPVMTAEFMNGLSADTLGADYGITRAIFFGFGSLGPTYVGVVGDRTTFTTAYFGLVACFLLAAVVILRILSLK